MRLNDSTKSLAKALGVSVGVHATLIAIAIVSVAGHSLAKARASRSQSGVVGDDPRGGTSGVGSVAAPTVGPSLNPALGAKYVGRYESRSSSRSIRVFEVHLINDGEMEHWSLAVVENQGPLRTLNAVVRDTFVFQLAPEQRVLFRRAGDSVTSISIRRGRDTSWAERVTKP